MSSNPPKLSSLSVFFPAFNEERNIPLLVQRTLAVLPSIAKKYEVIIVDDGSSDKTFQIGKKMSQQYKFVRVVTQPNLGYGGAVKRGFAESNYEWIFFSDADLQFNISELKSFIQYTPSHKVLLGYRVNRAEGWKRVVLAEALKIWNWFWLDFPLHIKDIDCAFKLIHRDVIQQALPLRSNGAMMSTELLLKIINQKQPLIQLGVTHYPRKAGSPSGGNFRVILRAMFDTYLLLWQKN